MTRLHILLLSFLTLAPVPMTAGSNFTFDSIDGGTLALDDWNGGPVLIVNTASRCAFTKQYDGLQTLYDTYRDKGLVVLAVPSDDFRQELDSAQKVKDFCEVNFSLDIPMTDITSVKGKHAHPFYAWMKQAHGFEPGWNFHKILLDANGDYVAGYGSTTKPMSRRIVSAIEAQLQ